MPPFSWTCPYCDKITTITNSNVTQSEHPLFREFRDDCFVLVTKIIICPDHECQEYTITAVLRKGIKSSPTTYNESDIYPVSDEYPILSWSMKPQSYAKKFPNYIPKAIIANYEEACLIQNLSPKASAALARRCLQGMIRDFWKVNERNLFEEINAIEGKVDPQTWQAISAVRSIGNIGAHMEKDINLIIDVEPKEANALIRLIEIVIGDWYIAKHEREKALASVIGIGNQKSKERKGNN